MKLQNLCSMLRGIVGLAALLVIVPILWTQEAQPDADAPPAGVEVLARGPVHEAYAEPAGGKVKASPIVNKPAPEPIEEVPPDEKPDSEGVQWLPGYWAFDEERGDYLWVSGFWRVPPPGRLWVPGRWDAVEGGWQWVPGFWAAPQQQQEITYLPPPPEPLEAAASVPAPTADHVYVSGYWVYRDNRYVWRPGYWYLPRADWVWVPAHYVWTPGGYVFVEGYWDHTLRNRGLLFAPVYVDVAVCRRPGWYYSPRHVIHDDCLVTALFVRPGHCHYYFGDYFEPRHRTVYIAYNDYRHGGCYDPIYTSYRYHHRHEVGWEVTVRHTYAGRYSGEIARPPRTLIQQNTVVNNITVNNINNTTVNNVIVNKEVNVNNVKNNVQNVQMVSSLKQVQNKGVALKTVAPEDRQVQQAAAKEIVNSARQRQTLEVNERSRGTVPTKPTDAPRVMKVDVPKPPATHAAIAKPAAKVEAVPGKVGPTIEAKSPQPAPAKNPLPATVAPKVEAKPSPASLPPKLDPKAMPAAAPKAEMKSPPAPTPVAKPGPAPVAKPAPAPTPVAKPVPLVPTSKPEVKPSPAPAAQERRTPPARPQPAKADTKPSGKSDEKKEKDKDKDGKNRR